MRENLDQKNSEYGHFLRSELEAYLSNHLLYYEEAFFYNS